MEFEEQNAVKWACKSTFVRTTQKRSGCVERISEERSAEGSFTQRWWVLRDHDAPGGASTVLLRARR